jgi:hypothetical protein
MKAAAVIIAFAVIFAAGAIWGGKPPKAYAVRRCMGRKWKETFPEVPKADIRRFLLLFVDAFAFKDEYMLRFEPSDRVLGIYHATTGKWGIDSMELETLADSLEKEYQLSLGSIWKDGLTLGELFGLAVSARQSAPTCVRASRG